jgi:pimeloyl-ACP methyl ester carboxylesterase
MRRKWFIPYMICVLIVTLFSCSPRSESLEFQVDFTESVSAGPIDGRVFVMLDDDTESNPLFSEKIIFAVDVKGWRPGEDLVLDRSAMGFPYSLEQLPAGQYAVCALVDRNDLEWGLPDAPGNAYSSKAVIDIATEQVRLTIDNVVVPKPFAETELYKEVRVPSELLSEFYGRPIEMEAAVILPPSYDQDPGRLYPVVYTFPGYGGLHEHIAQGEWNQNRYGMNKMGMDKIFVFMDHDCPLGYHCFADSENNGPRGQAFITEFLPYIKKNYRVIPEAGGRLLTGQSSGAWAALWLQVTYPDHFGGAWPVSPDPVDFRNFCGVDLYDPGENVFFEKDRSPRPLIVTDGETVFTWREISRKELITGAGGWMNTFEGVFSPRGKDGNPMPMWDRDSGEIDQKVVRFWKRYDIRAKIAENWETLGPKLQGKIFLYVADDDDARLDDPIRLFQKSMAGLGSDAFIEILETGGHGDGVWKQIIGRIHEQMDALLLRSYPDLKE